jgi:hypothetical protein
MVTILTDQRIEDLVVAMAGGEDDEPDNDCEAGEDDEPDNDCEPSEDDEPSLGQPAVNDLCDLEGDDCDAEANSDELEPNGDEGDFSRYMRE